eukprot:CAMPEP_0170578280 /NCGR_PEP_ID=MMETSP0224-20130122/5372_1 /TAXON_ID=285029 /ORGANISM="Togula jolla, Strain CCCM 725" /LENGTH=445 /DNA_ID=CAMNT_0010901239 /DNA_START=445 /DNA_END=1783 /DNA_ORIENTATION=+
MPRVRTGSVLVSEDGSGSIRVSAASAGKEQREDTPSEDQTEGMQHSVAQRQGGAPQFFFRGEMRRAHYAHRLGNKWSMPSRCQSRPLREICRLQREEIGRRALLERLRVQCTGVEQGLQQLHAVVPSETLPVATTAQRVTSEQIQDALFRSRTLDSEIRNTEAQLVRYDARCQTPAEVYGEARRTADTAHGAAEARRDDLARALQLRSSAAVALEEQRGSLRACLFTEFPPLDPPALMSARPSAPLATDRSQHPRVPISQTRAVTADQAFARGAQCQAHAVAEGQRRSSSACSLNQQHGVPGVQVERAVAHDALDAHVGRAAAPFGAGFPQSERFPPGFLFNTGLPAYVLPLDPAQASSFEEGAPHWLEQDTGFISGGATPWLSVPVSTDQAVAVVDDTPPAAASTPIAHADGYQLDFGEYSDTFSTPFFTPDAASAVAQQQPLQ